MATLMTKPRALADQKYGSSSQVTRPSLVSGHQDELDDPKAATLFLMEVQNF